MSDGTDSRQAGGGEDLKAFITEFCRSSRLIAICMVACIAAAIVYLKVASYTYSAEIKVVPTQSSNGQLGSAFKGLASVAGVGMLSQQPVAPIELYKSQIYSRVVADRLASQDALMHHIFAGEWNAAHRQWVQPPSRVRAISHGIKRLLGLPITTWRAPDGLRMQAFVRSQITLTESRDSPVIAVGMSSADPDFAVAFLAALHQATDEVIRRSAQRRATQYIHYLNATLPTVAVTEQRAALAALLSEQEKNRMLASASVSYAADMIDAPFRSEVPTSPRPFLVLIGALIAGLAVSLAVIVARLP